jgi:hypothetical protein
MWENEGRKKENILTIHEYYNKQRSISSVKKVNRNKCNESVKVFT